MMKHEVGQHVTYEREGKTFSGRVVMCYESKETKSLDVLVKNDGLRDSFSIVDSLQVKPRDPQEDRKHDGAFIEPPDFRAGDV